VGWQGSRVGTMEPFDLSELTVCHTLSQFVSAPYNSNNNPYNYSIAPYRLSKIPPWILHNPLESTTLR